ncbi:beta-glucosidase [Bacteroides faecichinchillae]|uniref:Beta-glucosidase n=1 Tax=Bacteroides faecichinchillae TaxID=871325 RepID=A0A1M4V7N7_9BACE|nr:glycoside hydrolase family 3 C-terminal domain-containing protein [Bacteroides faecichinchillae]THG69382.1 glycosyl hydrolase [Bacteroides faecichinchillae]SHE64985.1 beta-glucosidase [Bacteroides faecichinchillae]
MIRQWTIACFAVTCIFQTQAQNNAPEQYPYQDIKLSAEQRTDDLLQRLTLEEKVSLMQNASPAIPRLGIKPYEWWSEALHGIARAGRATVFPQSIGMAASFDDVLLYEVFNAVSDEARAKNRNFNEKGQYDRYKGLTVWTPNINIFRDPRWGRGQETYGEDPYLTGRMGIAVVRGLQGPEDAKYNKLHACAKHYAVHSGPEWNRHNFNAENIDPRDLWETYLPAFKDLVQKAGVKEVMCAYNRFEGDPCCGSKRLLTQILRNEWGYKGIVVSDCGAIGDFFQPHHHNTHPDAAHASVDAVLSGTDLECGDNYKSITEAAKQGLISEEKINTSVRRLLKARFELGEMNPTHPWAEIPYSVVDCPKHKELALKIAHESLVLLQNKDNLLPLNRQMKVAVIGPNANDSVMQWGNYNGFPSHTVTLLEGIRAKLPQTQIIYEPICGLTDAIHSKDITAQKSVLNEQVLMDKVKDADVIIFAGGISPQLEGEEMDVSVTGFKGGDRTDIELPAIQREVLSLLKNNGKKVVFINFSGSAMAIVPESENCNAILQAWYPGQAGGSAIADVLFGDYNPSGRLPITFYKGLEQLPDYENYSMKGRTYRYMTEEPLFPFGYGLSYTRFSYGKAKLNQSKLQKGEKVILTIPVKNVGQQDGAEVVQVYISRPDDKEGPQKTLRAFQRVNIAKGEKQNVNIELPYDSFEWFDSTTNTMHPIDGTYKIYYGSSSKAEDLRSINIQIQ